MEPLTTRSVARQQQFEEQVASILATMQEQGRSLAEQAQHSERRQTQLMHELQEQHQQQMAKISREYEHHWNCLDTAQTETSEAVTALESNLSDVKSVMQGRIGDAEFQLGQLQTWQEELAGKQNDFQTDVREELLRIKSALELSTELKELPTHKPLLTSLTCKSGPSNADDSGKPGPKPLSVTAQTIIPSAGSGSTALCGGGTRADVATEGSGPTSVQRPPPFDGKSTWEAYHAQFSLLAELNGWTEQRKATYLAISLRGSALTVLTNLPEEQRRDYTALSAALQNRFGNTRQVELNRAQLRGRTKRREETLPELAEDVERLARLAYPDAAEEMVIVLAKDQFIDALPDEDTRLRIRQSRPIGLRQALETAMELESYSIASKKAKQVRNVHLVKSDSNEEKHPTDSDDILKQLEACIKAM